MRYIVVTLSGDLFSEGLSDSTSDNDQTIYLVVDTSPSPAQVICRCANSAYANPIASALNASVAV